MENELGKNMAENKPKVSTKLAFAQALDEHTALENVRELGRVFVQALFAIEVKPKATSELMNGLVAYEQLGLKGQWDYMDKSVDIVMNAVYEEAISRFENDNTTKD
jgi:hypothetical protein